MTRPTPKNDRNASANLRSQTSADSTQPASAAPQKASGLGVLLAVLSAFSFATSGSFATALQDAGWSPGGVLLARIGGGALVLALPTYVALRGHWHVVRHNAVLIVMFGIFAVFSAQFFFYMALTKLDVGLGLLLLYLSPLMVVAWRWARYRQRPSRLTGIGAVLAILGVMVTFNIVGVLTGANTAGVPASGLIFGVLAAMSLTVYWILAAKPAEGLPPVALAGLGLTIGALVLGLTSAVGIIPATMTNRPVEFAGTDVPTWVAVAGVITFAGVLSYSLGGIAARDLGPTLASFIAMVEIPFAVIMAWFLLGQDLNSWQLGGGALIVAGVVAVKLGER